ncbi:MAG: SIS domain-containing protein [Chitinophagales bacterium]|jgi:D-sedoheptulose 7-phosphate isomerase|nr:SIS domain-containing protein [Chitinophagales bacterium]
MSKQKNTPEFIAQRIAESIAVKQNILGNPYLMAHIEQTANLLTQTFAAHGKVLLCGNGGSAADAQHIAAELSGRFFIDRPALFAEALHVNTSFLTAVANDYGYESVFARMVQAMGKKNDVLIAISTSGNSPNVVRAAQQAKEQGMKVVGMTGEKGGQLANLCDFCLQIPSVVTPRIQEAHILIGHIWCEWVEQQIFGA